MTLDEFRQAYQDAGIIRRIISGLEEDSPKLSLKGLIGSSRSVVADAVTHFSKGYHLFILRDKEEAAFFLNDLQNLKKMLKIFSSFHTLIKNRIS